jgi:DNA-binding SARP family transcriptional activator
MLAIAAVTRLAAIDPLREGGRWLAMQLYAESGRRGAALRQFEPCRMILDRELGAVDRLRDGAV